MATKKYIPPEIICKKCLLNLGKFAHEIYINLKCSECRGTGITPIPINELITPDNVYKNGSKGEIFTVTKNGRYCAIYLNTPMKLL